MSEQLDQQHKRRVLIVEDEPIVSMSLEMILEIAGFEVAGVATTLQEALSKVDEPRFDVAVVDVNLRGAFSGPFAEALRKAGIPFVVVTGYDHERYREKFPPDTRFLQKPYRGEALTEALSAAMS